jgi:hypothetical protein
MLDNPNVGIPRLVQGIASLEDDSLLDPGVQVVGQLILQFVARVNDQSGMHVAPELLQHGSMPGNGLLMGFAPWNRFRETPC